MSTIPYPQEALQRVADVYNFDRPDQPDVTDDNFYVVWFSKTLQNWKALVGTDIEPGRYYEVTFNGDKQVTYVDIYQKVSNVAISYVPPTS